VLLVLSRESPSTANGPVPAGAPPTVAAAVQVPTSSASADVFVTPPVVAAEEPSPRVAADAATVEEAMAADAAPVPATVRVTGLPRGAILTLDGQPSEPEFQLPVDDVEHTVRVLWRGRVVWSRPFRVDGDTTLEADIPARLLTASTERSDAGAGEPPPPPPPPPRDAAVAPLANPFQ
jgi:hypothetical protein